MLLVGSQALRYHIPLERESPDYDYIATYDEIKTFVAEKKKQGFKSKAVYPTDNGKKYLCIFEKDNVIKINEFEIAWPGSVSEQLLQLAEQDVGSIRVNDSLLVASYSMLYMLKMSHRFKKNSVHFLKTMDDIIYMRSPNNPKCCNGIPDEWQEWYKARESETYNYGHPKLNTDTKSFFKDDFYIYDHDDIHRAVKHLELPAYEYYKSDNEQVLCSKEKFFNVNEQTRLYGVLEEAYVLALESSQIPFVLNAIDSDKTKQPTRKWSFEKALEKICSSITSGFFRSWAYDNYYQVLALYNENYVDRFIEVLNNGQIKRLIELNTDKEIFEYLNQTKNYVNDKHFIILSTKFYQTRVLRIQHIKTGRIFIVKHRYELPVNNLQLYKYIENASDKLKNQPPVIRELVSFSEERVRE